MPSCDNCPPERGRCIATNKCVCHAEFVHNATDHCVQRECVPGGCRPNGDCVEGLCECHAGYKFRPESSECLPVCDFCEGEDECRMGTTQCTCWDSYEEQEVMTKGEVPINLS